MNLSTVLPAMALLDTFVYLCYIKGKRLKILFENEGKKYV